MLYIENLTKEYPAPRPGAPALRVLEDVSLEFHAGESVSVMGPSGSGKSSLLYVLGALDRPTSGRVTLDDADPFALQEAELAEFRNQHVGFIFQDHCLLPQLTVLENVLLPTLATARGPARQTASATSPEGHASGPGDANARARWLLSEVGLAERLDHRPAELSGGEKQRVAIARALIMAPQLLLCDEPTGNLDRASAESVTDLLLRLHAQQQTILIIVTHNPELAARCAHRYVLRERALHAS